MRIVKLVLLVVLLITCRLQVSAQTPGLVRWASGSSSNTTAIAGGGPATNYTFRLPEVTQAGNAIALCVVSGDASTTATVTDDAPGGSNTWTSVVTGVDSTNHMRVRLWIALNMKAGTRTITPAFTTTYPDRVAVTGAEFYNIALSSAVDASNSSSSASGSSTMSAGSITPTTSGDLIYQCGVRSQTPEVNVATPYTAGSQSNMTWNLQATDNWDGLVSQWGVYNSTSVINPQLTMASNSGYVSASMALRSASAGSPLPSGMQIVGIEHVALSKPIGGVTPKHMQLPSIGNLLIASIGPGGTNYAVTSITDSNSNSWISAGAVLGDSNAGKSQKFYAQNATSSNNLAIVTNWTGGNSTSDASILFYDVVGAAASAFVFHQSATNVLDGSIGSGSQFTAYSNVPPGTANGMAFAQMSVSHNTVCGSDNNLMILPAAALCDSYSYGGEPLNGPEPVDQNNGWAHYTFSTNANQTWTWPFVTNSLIGFYASTLDFFASGSSEPAPHKPVIVGSLPAGTVGLAYSSGLSATGATSPLSWSMNITVPGLSLNTTTGVLSGTPSTPGTYNLTFSLTDSYVCGPSDPAGCTSTASPYATTLTINALPTFTPIRVKPGASYTDSQGNTWATDTAYCSGGSQYATTHAIAGALPASTDGALYQTERYNNPVGESCSFPVPAATYSVTMKFSENWVTRANDRVFSVTINGTTVLSGLDIFASAGVQYKAIDKTFAVTTAGTPISIGFINAVNNAKYDAIQIVSSGPPPPPQISVSIAPTAATLAIGTSQQFTATVLNDPANAGVTWSANAPAGLFIAPNTPGTASVTATSVTDPTKIATATVTITLPPQSMTTACTWLSDNVTWRCDSLTVNVPSGQTIRSVITTGTQTNTVSGVHP